jgi:hypothetical protein
MTTNLISCHTSKGISIPFISHNFFDNDKENHDIKLVFVSKATALEPMMLSSLV